MSFILELSTTSERISYSGSKSSEPPTEEGEVKQEEKEEPGGWQLPGKEFGEFIRKIQSVRLNPFNKPQDEEIIEPVQEQVSNADQETSGQAINDWIMENIGVSDFSKIILSTDL